VIRIGACSFPTKIAAEKYIQEILGRHDHGQPLAGADDEFIRALIEIHPYREAILDCGIQHVFVQHLDRISWQRHPGARRFCVRRTDTSIYDFSWRDALSPRPPFARLSAVLRHVIAEYKEAVKHARFEGACEHCGRAISWDECDLDHEQPQTFEKLIRDFLVSIGKSASDLAIVKSRKYQCSSYLEDNLIADAWYEYHHLHARLRCVCQRCNLSTLRKKPKARAAHET